MSKHSYGNRLTKIEAAARAMARKKPTQDLTGWSHEKVCDAVEKAIDSADDDLTDSIDRHVAELAAVPWHNMTTKEKYLDEDGNDQPTPHHFVYWLLGLEVGSWHLPKRIPREVLEGFDELYGAVIFRCEDCLTGLGNSHLYSTCPVCGSEKLSVKCLSCGDPKWHYTPLPHR